MRFERPCGGSVRRLAPADGIRPFFVRPSANAVRFSVEYVFFLSVAIFFAVLPTAGAWTINIWPSSEQLLNRDSGQNLAVSCTIANLHSSDDIDVNVQWFKKGEDYPIEGYGRIMTSKIRSTSLRLMFTEPTIEDSGMYTCNIRLGNGETQEKSVKISFAEAIDFTDTSENQHPENGKDAELVCNVRGDSSVEIYWQFKGKNIIEGWPRGYELRNNNRILFIPKFDAKIDDGLYFCRATQFFSFKILSINVTAYARPKITVFEGYNRSLAYEGSDLVLRCQATGKPKPIYSWTKNINGVDTDIIPSSKYSIDGGLLKIHSLMPYDDGLYACIAKNILDSAKFSLSIIVFRKPKIELMENETRLHGESLELSCHFNGDGNISAKWVHRGQQWIACEDYAGNCDETRISETVEDSRISVRLKKNVATLMISSVEEHDAGEYQCVAENEAGSDRRSTFLSIIHSPTIIDKSEKILTVLGGRVVLFCKAAAVPDPSWTWLGPSRILEADGSTIIIDTLSVFTNLTVTSVGKDDFGTYICIADNGIGDADKAEITVVQIHIPERPKRIKCHEQMFPNYAICIVEDYIGVDVGRRPKYFTFIYEKLYQDESGKEEPKSMNLTYKNDEKYKIENLSPVTEYSLRVSASNEAGSSDFSDDLIFKTSQPKVPEAPNSMRYACTENCALSWEEPNDNGSPVKAYHLLIREIENRESKQNLDIGYELDIDGNQRTIDLSFLKPMTAYEIQLTASNGVGNSKMNSITFNTPEVETNSNQVVNISAVQIAIFIAIILLFVLLIIDVICYIFGQCGLIACFCVNCLGKNLNNKKKMSGEENNRREVDRLLEGSDGNKNSNRIREKGTSTPYSTSV